MASPFPGMDPYLEGPDYWRGTHQLIIGSIVSQLGKTLPPGFSAKIEERLYIVEPPQRNLYPDVGVYQRSRPLSGVGGNTSTAVLSLKETPPLRITVLEEEESIRESYIEIIFGRGREVVTVIELLSPANKTPGSAGRDAYVAKQTKLMRGGISLLEIDLLRSGSHAAAVPLPSLPPTELWSYLISLHRADAPRNEYDVWTVSLREPLPVVRIPLTPDHPDTLLDLQAAFNRSYDDGAFDRDIDYTQPPNPPLRGVDAAWANTLLTN